MCAYLECIKIYIIEEHSPIERVPMWDKINSHFTKYPAQNRVAQLMFEHGLQVKENTAYCGGIAISDTALAKAADTDRRTVLATISTIEETEELNIIFSRLESTCSFKEVAPYMGWGVLEIIPDNVSAVGILAETTRFIADAGISIRQVIADDPDMHQDPRAFIITERPIPGALLSRIKEVRGVKGVVIY
jgi:predicted regulator of amino acid metabolism with ACT domain